MIVRADLEAGALKHRRDLMCEHRPLILGHADRTVKRRGAVAIQIHERVHAVRIERDERTAGLQDAEGFGRTTRGIGKMMHQSAEQDAIKACGRKRQMLDVALEELHVRILGSAQCNQFRTDVEPDRFITLPAQKIGEDAGAATKIGDSRAAASTRPAACKSRSAACCSRA